MALSNSSNKSTGRARVATICHSLALRGVTPSKAAIPGALNTAMCSSEGTKTPTIK